MTRQLEEMFGVEPLDEASPFVNWFKKKQAQRQVPDDAGDQQLQLPGTATPRQRPPEPEAPPKRPQADPPKKPSVWSRLGKMFDDPDFDPENRVKLTDVPAKRYYIPHGGIGRQPEEPMQAAGPGQDQEPEPDDPYEREQRHRAEMLKWRLKAARLLDKLNGMNTPDDPKEIGKNVVIAPFRNRPGYYRAYYPGLERGYIVVFNPNTGYVAKKLKEREWYETQRSARGGGSRGTKPQRAEPQTSKVARDQADDLKKNAIRTVKKYNPEVDGEVETRETDRGTEYFVKGGDVKVLATKDGRLHKFPVETKDQGAPAKAEKEPAGVPSQERAKELGDLDPGMQKAIQRKKHIEMTKMSEQDLVKSLERENGYSADQLPIKLVTQASDKGIFYIPTRDGQLAPGTHRILFRGTDGRMKFLDSRKGTKASDADVPEHGDDDESDDDELE